jgi:membrane protein involved in colicin uptake
MYKLLREQQAEDMKKKQAHQHQIWQHVQDRLAEHNQILEQEKAEESKKARRQQQKEVVEAAATMDEEDNEDTAAPIISTGGADEDSSTVTSSASTSPETTPAKKRAIRWGLQNNQTKRMWMIRCLLSWAICVASAVLWEKHKRLKEAR